MDQRDLVIDAHALIETQSGFLPGLPKAFLDFVRPDLLLFIAADSQEILRRRTADRTIGRERDSASQEEIDRLRQRMSEIMVVSYSLYSGAPFQVVPNHDGQLDLAVQSVKRAIEALG